MTSTTSIVSKLPSPNGLKFYQWGSAVSEQLAAFGVAPPSEVDDHWKEWACGLFYIPALGAAPTPMEFESWDAWAARFVETFS